MKKIYLVLISVLALVAVSCAKQDTVYKEFIKDGGLIYPAKPINVEARRGFQRVVLNWDLPMDPSIHTAKLYWDSRTQSMDFDYASFPDGKVSVVIPNLEDRSYTFEVVNFDANNNSSLAAEITTSPFGDSWLVSHAERSVVSTEMDGTSARVTLGSLTDEVVATKFRYLKTTGETVETVVLSSEKEVLLPNAQQWKYYEYQSAFCAAEGIDTVWTGNWMRSPYPIASRVDDKTATVTVTDNQIRGSFMPNLILDGIKDDGNSRWFSSNDASYRGLFPKILVIDTKRNGDNAMTFNHFVFYQDPDPDRQDKRFIKNVEIFVGDTKFNPNDTNNYSRSFGEPVATLSLNKFDPIQETVLKEPKRGRYVAIVFLDSHDKSGFIDLWELDAFGFVSNSAN